MTTKVVPGMLIASPDSEGVAREASARMARIIREAIATRGEANIALSGGETPRVAYTRLAQEAGILWNKVRVFWVDERAVPAEDDRSNYHHAKESLIDPAKIPADRIHRMPADEKDLDAAAREYEAILSKYVPKGPRGAPQLDLVILGIGEDGHTASLFPGLPTVDITDRFVAAVPAHADLEPRLTLTVPVIEETRNAIVLAVGKKKQEPLERVWQTSGDIHKTPARIVRGVRGSLAWIIDKAAGGLG
ncbi:MAG: 6-phosphogluconolactonase [Polyangiaceae bacterium]